MFFISEDLKKKNENSSLRSIIDEENIKVAYGVLGIGEYLNMVKHIGSVDYIYIPKVQRGLKWDEEQQERFIDKCVTGTSGVLEPMPNVFLFFDEESKEIQLFDGLQRTNAMMSYFKGKEVTEQVMIPTALFKGTRREAEDLFRHINDRGVKLNDFEKLASFGAQFPITFNTIDDKFKTSFNEFTTKMNKPYKEADFSITTDSDISLYEVLMYSIYSFANNEKARKIFKIKSDDKLIDEWGFQVVYSALTKNKSRKYTKTLLLKDVLNDFAEEVGYKAEEKTFDVDLVNNFISKMKTAIHNSEKAVRDIYLRNVNAKTSESLAMKAIASNALIGSLVVTYYINPYLKSEEGTNNMMNWYLTQLIIERPGKSTNTIVDELLKVAHESPEYFKDKLSKSVINVLNSPESKTSYAGWLWTLYVVQYYYISDKPITAEFDIDHIIPKSILRKMKDDQGMRVFENEEINGIGNLALITRKVNQNKSDLWISDLPLAFKEKMKDESIEKQTKAINAYESDYRSATILGEPQFKDAVFETRDNDIMFYTKKLKEAYYLKDFPEMKKQFDEIRNLRIKWMISKFQEN